MELVRETESVAKFDNNIVDNNAIKFEKKLSINQQKILYYLLIQEKKGAILQGTTWNELQKILGIRNSTLRERKEFIEDIRSVSVNMCIDKENMEYHYIFPSIGLRYNKLFYTINPEVIKLFDEPEIKYYLMNFEYFRNFKHEHSLKLYQLLNKQLGANDKSTHDFTYEIEELKLYLGVENTKAYMDFSNFRRRILEPSFAEISEYSDIKIEGKYNPRTKKHQLFSKVIRKEQIFIGGISRKNTVQEYVQEQFDNAIIAKEESKTKINKEPKLGEETIGVEKCKEIIHSFGEYGHVKFNEEQFYKSKDLFDSTEEFNKTITLLDEYFEQNPDKRYKNHYIAMKKMKKILEKQKIQTSNNTYKKQDLVYEEPIYDVPDTTEADEMSEEEAKALLDNPFGENKDVEKSDVEKLVRKVLEAETDIAKIVEDVPEHEFEQMENEEEIVNNDGINNIPTGLFNDAIDLYFWFFEGVVSKEQVPNGLKKLEEKHNYTLSKEEKLKLYHEAKETHERKYPW